MRSLGAVRAQPAVTLMLLIGLIVGFTYLTLPSAAIAQVRTITQANAKAVPVSGSGQSGLIDMVVLVDESGSETAESVADEQATTLEVASSLLNPESRVTVIGFGGVNNPSANQDPTNVACPPTLASNQNTLATCVKQDLYPRKASQGNDTDYAAALGQAMSYFDPTAAAGQQSPPGATKVILMMTDGAADVHNDTKQYTSDWYDGELTAVNDQLATARKESVQFWALGFGSNIGTVVDGKLVTKVEALKYLDNMAAAGAPANCNGVPAPVQPYARWVDSSSDAFTTMGQLSADASCDRFDHRLAKHQDPGLRLQRGHLRQSGQPPSRGDLRPAGRPAVDRRLGAQRPGLFRGGVPAPEQPDQRRGGHLDDQPQRAPGNTPTR